jgi:hypothetical protein
VEAVGEVEPVADEEHLDLCLQQGADDLMADLGSFALVGPGEGLVEQHQTVRPDLAGDGAHAPQLVVQPSAGHAGIFFPDEVGEDPAGGIRPVGLGGDEQPALHHELGHADAAQERGFPSRVGAGDDDQGFPIGLHVISHHRVR